MGLNSEGAAMTAAIMAVPSMVELAGGLTDAGEAYCEAHLAAAYAAGFRDAAGRDCLAGGPCPDELERLAGMLDAAGIAHTPVAMMEPGAWQLLAFVGREGRRVSAACSPFSYGGSFGLVETWDMDCVHEPVGFQTAEDAFRRILVEMGCD